MPSRETLIPLIWCNEGDLPFVHRLLDKWENRISDVAVCLMENVPVLESLLKRGKRVVPSISSVPGWLSLRDFRLTVLQADYVHYLEENAKRFQFIQVGNWSQETHADRPAQHAEIIRDIWRICPRFCDRLMVSPWHTDVEEECRQFTVEKAPIRNALLNYARQACLYSGIKLCDMPEFREWIQGMNVWCGIDYIDGAANHNLVKILDYGYSGAVFFLPVRAYSYDTTIHAFENPPLDWDEANRMMEMYVTDVE